MPNSTLGVCSATVALAQRAGSFPNRYLAGLTAGYELDDAARQVLADAGAKVVTYHSRLDLVVLEIACPADFVAPAFVEFLEADTEMSRSDAPEVP